MKINFTLLILIVSSIIPLNAFSQKLPFMNTHILRYFAAKSEPDKDWFMPGYDDSAWPEDTATIGFGYREKGYRVIDSTAKSLYVRFPFTIGNLDSVKILNFIADFDDGFIAYINGIEVARVNVDESVQYPPFNAIATRSHASDILTFSKGKNKYLRTFLGRSATAMSIHLDSTKLDGCLVKGENIMAVHVINDNEGNDLMFMPLLLNTTYSNYNFYTFDSRYKRLIDLDSTNLPLINIETNQNGIAYDQTIWATAHMGIINNGEGIFNKPTDPYNEYDGLIKIRTRGQSSRDFPKRSFRLELVDENAADTSFALLGMPKESDWVLFGPYTDKSQIRNKFVYDLAAKMGHYAPRTRFCELVLNGIPEGLYLLTEQVKRDKNRVDISKLKETDISGKDVTGGYIFMFDKPKNFASVDTTINGRLIVYPDILKSEQKQYLKRFFTVYDSILNRTNDFADPLKGFRKYASDTSLVDFIIINEITKNCDSYLNSTYMYKDRDDKDGRMKFGPVWDYDLCFGNTNFQNGSVITGWQFDTNTKMFIHRYFQDTKFVKLFQDRWHELRAKTYSNESIFSFFDELVDQVKLVRERNYDVWPLIDKDLAWPAYEAYTYDDEISIVKNWLTTRLEWIDENVDKIYYPLKRIGNNPLESIAGNLNLRVYPNPFESELSINLNLEKESNVRIEIYNMTGQLQHQISRENASEYVDFVWNDSKLSALKSGMYVAKVYVDGNPCQSIKIIKR